MSEQHGADQRPLLRIVRGEPAPAPRPAPGYDSFR